MKASSTDTRGWRKALGLVLCLYFITLNAVIHSLHTHGPVHASSRHDAIRHTSHSHDRLDIMRTKTCECDNEPGTCIACRYLSNCVGSNPGSGTATTSPALPERLAAPKTRIFCLNQRMPSFPRAPPIFA